jgi:deoxyribodipyrimidine photolyase
MHITLKESSEMKYMGWNWKACYKTQRGVPFTRYFNTAEELQEFNKKVTEVGSQFIIAVSLKGEQYEEE